MTTSNDLIKPHPNLHHHGYERYGNTPPLMTPFNDPPLMATSDAPTKPHPNLLHP